MDIIHLLPDSVANQIAAGEVIQRPASCLKELVENSLDAGATHIQVIIRDAGKTLLQVIDNGSGMSETDVRMAFERHATSKIRRAEDLYKLRTMGFRGEALASICAVAHVEVLTRRVEDEVGTLLEIAGSEVVRQEPCQCSVGTNIRIKNLFYNIPVRRKFLKTDQTELRNLMQEFHRIVLIYPDIQFTLVSDDEIIMELPACTAKQRIQSVFGKTFHNEYSASLIDIGTETDIVKICGYIGKPEKAGKSAQQFFFVNGRYMRHPYFHKAVINAYSGMLSPQHAPSYFIYFTMHPENIDVNIHPTKTEIKFADEQPIFQILVATVREALGKFNITPSIDFMGGNIDMPVPDALSTNVAPPHLTITTGYNPFHYEKENATCNTGYTPSDKPNAEHTHTPKPYIPQYTPEHVHQDWRRLYEDFTATPQLFTMHEDAMPYQFSSKYILMPSADGLMIINQHRAHICVLYDQLMSQMRQQKGIRQQLLFPEVIELSADRKVIMDKLLPDLNEIGYTIIPMGPSTYSIDAMPAVLGAKTGEDSLNDILSRVIETGADVQVDWQHAIALEVAKSSAIPYGKVLTDTEMQDLLHKLFMLKSYRLTPDGKTVISLISNDEISRRFL